MRRTVWLAVAAIFLGCTSTIAPRPDETPRASPSIQVAPTSVVRPPSPSPTARGEVIADVGLAGPAFALAVDARQQRLFVRLADSVEIIDGASLKPLASVPVPDGNQWTGLAFDDVYDYLWAPSFTGTVSLIATAAVVPTVVATIPVERNSGPVAVDRRTHLGYVVSIGREANRDSILGATLVVNPNSQRVVARLAARGFPTSVAVSSAAGRVYVSVRDPNPAASAFVQVIGADDLSEVASIGTSPLGSLAADERTNRIYAPTAGAPRPAGGYLTAIDGRTARAMTFVALGVEPIRIAIDAGRGHVYLASRDGRLVIATERDDMLLGYSDGASYAIGAQATGIAVDGSRHRAYVVTYLGRLVVLRDDWP